MYIPVGVMTGAEHFYFIRAPCENLRYPQVFCVSVSVRMPDVGNVAGNI